MRNASIRDCLLWCAFFLAFISLYTAISVAYIEINYLKALISVSSTNLKLAIYRISPSMKLDSLKHAVFGFILGFFALEPSYAIFSTFVSVFMDLDHAPFLLGIPVPARISHTLVFLAFANLFYFFLFRKGELIVVLTSSFLLHITFDDLNVPLLSPFAMSPKIPDCIQFALIPTVFCLNIVFVGRPRLMSLISKRREPTIK